MVLECGLWLKARCEGFQTPLSHRRSASRRHVSGIAPLSPVQEGNQQRAICICYCGDCDAGGAAVAGAGFFLRFAGVVLAGPSSTMVVAGGGAGWAAAAC